MKKGTVIINTIASIRFRREMKKCQRKIKKGLYFYFGDLYKIKIIYSLHLRVINFS